VTPDGAKCISRVHNPAILAIADLLL
jgi:hypothetical protein